MNFFISFQIMIYSILVGEKRTLGVPNLVPDLELIICDFIFFTL